MHPGEASRQYQAALEHRRTMRELAGGAVVSFDDELANLDDEVDAARGRVIDAIVSAESLPEGAPDASAA